MSFHPHVQPNLLLTFAKNVKITTNSSFLDKIYTVKNYLAIMGKLLIYFQYTPSPTIIKLLPRYATATPSPLSMYLHKIWHEPDFLVLLHLKFLLLCRTLCSVSQVPPGAKA
jgi:hypothetical protein